MRFESLFPILCIAISLICSFLALFAGTNHDMLESYDLLLINTSRIGHDILKSELANKTSNKPTPTPTGSLWSKATAKAGQELNQVESTLGQELQELDDDLDKAIASVARDLGLKDFYSIHIMDHCEGFFAPNGTAKRNVTYCSNSTGMSHFNLTAVLQQQLNTSHTPITLPNIHWPSAINDGIHNLELAFNAAFVLYLIGIIFTGCAFFLGFFAMVREGRLSALLNLGSSGTAVLFVTIASIVTTVGIHKAANAINKYGKDLNINAARGDKFISLTWASDALLILATLYWVVELLLGHRRSKITPKQLQ